MWSWTKKTEGRPCYGKNWKRQKNIKNRDALKYRKRKVIKAKQGFKNGNYQIKNVWKQNLNANRFKLHTFHDWSSQKIKTRPFYSALVEN